MCGTWIDYFSKCKIENNDKITPPLSRSLLLCRMIVNGIPDFMSDVETKPKQNIVVWPVMKILSDRGDVIAECQASFASTYIDGCFSLTLPAISLSGDILIRVYNKLENENLIPMFAFMFHISFIPNGETIVRLNKKDIDGCTNNPRFPEDFFLDMMFKENQPISGEVEETINNNNTTTPVANEKKKTLQQRENVSTSLKKKELTCSFYLKI